MNRKLRTHWEERTGFDPKAEARLKETEQKIANIRQAVEDGLGDAAWANERLASLAHRHGPCSS